MFDNTQRYINPKYSRIAVTYVFFACGTLAANWIVRIPDIQNKFSLSKGDLGWVLTGIPLGAVLVMIVIGNLISRYGSKRMTMTGTLAFHLILPILALMPSVLSLWFSLLLFGLATTAMDVSMNSQGIEVEKQLNKSAMSSFHAAFSIGGVAGAIIGFIFTNLSINPELHFLIVSIIFLPFSLISFQFLRTERQLTVYRDNIKKFSNIIQLPPREVWLLGLIAFIAVLGELMMNDWSSIFIITYTGVDTGTAAFGFGLFSLFMTFGRLIGDPLTNKFPTEKIVRIFAIIASIGLMIAVLIPNLVIIFIGFSCLGFGLSVIVPLVFKAAGNRPNVEIGTGVAGAGLFAYTAGIIEPIFVGQVADYSSLQISFTIVAIIITMIFFMGKALKPVKVSK
ncbi:MAG: MFS transporter [Candidatus Thorarchaeota archaeon]